MVKRAMIVDDNRIITDTLRGLVDWAAFGYEAPLIAYSGLQALVLIRTSPRDVTLVITDIRMPEMDGLSLIRAVKEIHRRDKSPEPRFVVLSAYDDFAYAREAFKLGASEYILKTEIDKETVENLLRAFDAEDRRHSEAQRMKDALMARPTHDGDVAPPGGMRTLEDQVRGWNAPKADETVPRIIHGAHAVMSVHLTYERKVLSEVWRGDLRPLIYTIYNLIGEVLERHGRGDVIGVDSEGFLILFSFAQSASVQEQKSEMQVIFEEIAASVSSCLGTSITAGAALESTPEVVTIIGKETDAQEGIAALSKRAIAACGRQWLHAGGTLYFDDEQLLWEKDAWKAESEDQDFQNANALLKYLKESLQSYQPEMIRSCSRDLAARLQHYDINDFREVVTLYQKIFFQIDSFVTDNELSGTFFDEVLIFSESSILSARELSDMLAATLERVAEAIANGGTLAPKLRKYIADNYSKDINLTLAAKQFGLNSKYLGRVFLKEMGVSFTLYLNEFRVQKAKELMMKREMKLYQIAYAVGYASFEHFSRVFKKTTGMNPKEFIKKSSNPRE